MFIIPYTFSCKHVGGKKIYEVYILTEGGRKLWHEMPPPSKPASKVASKGQLTPKKVAKTYLLPNDLIASTITPIRLSVDDMAYFCHIDTTRTDMKSMYFWNEVSHSDEETICWRRFVCFATEDNYTWLTPPKSITISSYPVCVILGHILKDHVLDILDGGSA